MIYNLYNAYYYYRYLYYSFVTYQSIKFSYDSYSMVRYIYDLVPSSTNSSTDKITIIEMKSLDNEWNDVQLYK